MSEWGRLVHFQTFKVGLRDRFKYWLRWRFEWLLRVLSHGRIRCIVLGHEHLPPEPVSIYFVPSIADLSNPTAEELAAGTDISDFIKETPQPFYLDESVLDDAFDDVHGEWPGDLRWWSWGGDEPWGKQGDDDVAT